MTRKEMRKERKPLLDWKMIRIPRVLVRVFVIFILILVLAVSFPIFLKKEGGRFPFLVKIGSFFGLQASPEKKQDEPDSNVMDVYFARLVYVKGDVNVKSQKELKFQKAEKDQILREGDTIRTYSGGYAEVLFDEGNKLTIKPDSLVVIHDMKENRLTKIRKSSINLLQSDVEAVVRRPKIEGSEFVIVTPTALAKISEAKVAVQVSKEQESKLKVFSGAVDVKVGGESMEVVRNQSVDISKEKKIREIKDLPAPPKLGSPENLAEFFFKNLSEMKMVLKWDDSLSGVTYRIQVALDPYFTDLVIVRTGLSEKGVVVQGLKSGIYYWRVSSITSEGNEGDFSDYSVFKITIDQTPPDIVLDDLLLLKVSGKVNAQISGQTEPDAAVTINDVPVLPDKTGRFKYVLSQISSDTEITIVAVDRVGNRKIFKKTVQNP